MERKTYCTSCKYFVQYYIIAKTVYKPVLCGFCTNETMTLSRRKRCTETLNGCEHCEKSVIDSDAEIKSLENILSSIEKHIKDIAEFVKSNN